MRNIVKIYINRIFLSIKNNLSYSISYKGKNSQGHFFKYDVFYEISKNSINDYFRERLY